MLYLLSEMEESEPEEDECEFEVDSTCYHNLSPESWTYEVSYERSEPQKIDKEPVPRKKQRSVAYIINRHPVLCS